MASKFVFHKILALSILSFLLLSSCKDENQKKKEEYQRQLDETKKILLEKQKEQYVIENSFADPETAVRSFLNAIIQSNEKNVEKYSFGREESENILLPNLIGDKSIIANIPLDQALEMLRLRRELGIKRIADSTEGKRVSVKRVIFNPKKRILNRLVGYEVEKVELNVAGKTVFSEQIKLVVEHKGQFKVAVVSP